MKRWKVMHKKSSTLIAASAKIADNPWDRLIGLMFSEKMNGFDGLIFIPGKSIHTCFMRYDIDVVFLNKENKVVSVVEKMKPWRFTKFYLKATKALELPAGKLKNLLQAGDEVVIECIS